MCSSSGPTGVEPLVEVVAVATRAESATAGWVLMPVRLTGLGLAASRPSLKKGAGAAGGVAGASAVGAFVASVWAVVGATRLVIEGIKSRPSAGGSSILSERGPGVASAHPAPVGLGHRPRSLLWGPHVLRTPNPFPQLPGPRPFRPDALHDSPEVLQAVRRRLPRLRRGGQPRVLFEDEGLQAEGGPAHLRR